MRRLAVACILSLVALSVVVAAEENPSWCKTGWVCVPLEEVAKDTEQHIVLHSEIIALKAKSRRFGLTAGCGFGVATTISDEWGTQTAPAGVCAVIWGVRF